MYPHERSLVEEMNGRPFVLIGVNSDDPERAREAVAENGLNWRSFEDQLGGEGKSISNDWRVHAWPTVVILDAEGKIRYRGSDGGKATEIAKELVAAMTRPDGA